MNSALYQYFRGSENLAFRLPRSPSRSSRDLQGASAANSGECVCCAANFRGLVLGGIEANFRKQILVGKLFLELSNDVILELYKGVHCVDLGESFQTHIFLQNLASIQPRTSPVKFAASERS